MLKTINHFQKKKVKLNKNLKVFVGTAPLNIADKKTLSKIFNNTFRKLWRQKF